MVTTKSGVERFKIDFDKIYKPYPIQAKFHASPVKHKLLGGAAGPGKTLCLIVEHMVSCNEFSDPLQAAQVHTLLLRRTHPKLEATVITRFQEKIPKELYKSFRLSPTPVVTWHNGSTTNFGSMQHEHDAWGYQGQWYKISYDELAEFTFLQWSATSAWNRCPVSKRATKDGASNPIGIGAGWLKKLFVDKKPCEEMDDAQKAGYNPADYEYFPCTYLDNPIYANDPIFIKNLEAYPAAIRDALKLGLWGAVGGYFEGAWDPAENVYEYAVKQPWHDCWLSGDWGRSHDSAIYWHYIDEKGVIRTYHELVVNNMDPEELALAVIAESEEAERSSPVKSQEYNYRHFYFSHDAFHKKIDPNTVALRMGRVLSKHGFPQPSNAGTDKMGREQLMRTLFRSRISLGNTTRDGHEGLVPELTAGWQISSQCKRLIDVIPTAPADEDNPKQIAEFLGDDPIAGAGHGVYGWLGRPSEKPRDVYIAEKLAEIPDFTRKAMAHRWLEKTVKPQSRRFRLR